MSHAQMSSRIAVLYQKHPPPEIEGARKPLKEGGYSDSGADIAYCLQSGGYSVVTPTPTPDPRRDLDWVFPDDTQGIDRAIAGGANLFWLNTVLYNGHSIGQFRSSDFCVVGQEPDTVHTYDNKWRANEKLRAAGLPVARAVLESWPQDGEPLTEDQLRKRLTHHHLEFPLIVKPVRGRGSQGVRRVDTVLELVETVQDLVSQKVEIEGTYYSKFGTTVIIEEYLPGEEITWTVMPPGNYSFDKQMVEKQKHWALPAVLRFNHDTGVVPYNGIVAVTQNSRLLEPGELDDGRLQAVQSACEEAARRIGAVAPVRIDCRARCDGVFQIFDVNLKPNMTGSGRPGRQEQDSLCCIAARGIHWTYADLLGNMLSQARPLGR